MVEGCMTYMKRSDKRNQWHKAIFDRARERNVLCFNTPFDEVAGIIIIIKRSSI